MIVRDEQRLLPTCLRAARNLSDDICIVDTGSRDASVAIAREHGARVVERAWQDDFAAARNESLRLAQRPWVIVLDADEMVSPLATAEIHRHVASPNIGALSLSIVDAQQHGTARVSRVLRAWRTDSRIRFRHRIHEDASWSVMPCLRERNQRLVHVAAPIAHMGYGSDEAQQKNKKARDQKLLERCVAEDPRDLYSWFKLLELGGVWRDERLSRRAAGRAQALLRDAPLAEIEHFLGDLVLHLHRDALARAVPLEQRLGWVRHWAHRAPHEATLATLEGQLLETQGNLSGAKEAFERALVGDERRPNVQMRAVRPTLGLARVALASGAIERGRMLAEKALALAPDDAEARVAVAALTKMHPREERT